jgi:alkylhydroperoxidase family enzyme
MLKAIIKRKLAGEERRLGGSLDYVRHILDTSFGAFLRFTWVLPLNEYRRALPADAYFVARLAATRDADCGTCLQIEANLARRAGVPADVVRAAVDGRPDALPRPLQDVHRLAEAVVRATYDEDGLREELRARFGERGLVELALAIASCRVFPVVKRTLGYAKSCAHVTVAVQ